MEIAKGGHLMTVQQRIRQLMEQRGWSEYRLAKESGLSQSTITKIFDRNTAPTLPTLEAICKTFHISLSQFFAEENEPIFLTPAQKEHLLLWSRLDEEQQKLLDNFFKTL